MADDPGASLLLQLVCDAVPLEAFPPEPGKPAPAGGNKPSAPPSSPEGGASSDLADGIAIATFLRDKEALDLATYVEWNRFATAWKNTYGEEGYDSFHTFSEAADNYDGEARCRKEWDAIKLREDGPRLTIATYVAQAKELGWKPARKSRGGGGRGGKASGGDDEGGGGIPKGTDPAAFTIELVEAAGDEFWLDQEDRPRVSYKAALPDGREVLRHAAVDSSSYRQVLADRFHKAALTKVLSGDHATLAVGILEYRAQESGARHVAALRVGTLEDRTYVDLGGPSGAVVEIDADGWRVVAESPVRFVRGSRGELPEPEPGGSIADFERHYNLSLDDLRRLIGFLVGAFNVGASYAILMTDGEQGSGKSTLNDKNVSLIDPPRQAKSARMSFNAKEQDLHIGALGVHVPYFDNVSSFTGDAADALCRISTGGGFGSRKLYTNDQYNEIVVIRPMIITCIGAPTSRPDLLDRSVRITAQPLVGHRRTERAVMRAFEKDRAKLFGFLLSCVSAAIRNRAAVEQAVESGALQLPRMADFAEFVEGAAEPLGLRPGEFSALIGEGQSAMQTEAVLGNPVGAGLVRYFSRADATPLDAPARDILSMLRDIMPEEKRWPASNMLRKALSRMSVGLRKLGIAWEVDEASGHDNVARFSIRATEAFQRVEETPSSGEDDGGGHF